MVGLEVFESDPIYVFYKSSYLSILPNIWIILTGTSKRILLADDYFKQNISKEL